MIREIEEKDFESIYNLGNQLNEKFSKLNNLENLLSNNIEKIYVYEEDSKILGFIHITILYFIDILNIFVDKNNRNKQIATKLLNYVEENNKNLEITLEVNENNKEAISFYKKNNFETLTIRKNYYNNKEDGYLMIRRIQ